MPVSRLYDGERNLIINAENADGTAETNLPLFNLNTLVPVPRTLVLQRATFSVAGGGVALAWEGTPNVPLLYMGAGGPDVLDYKRYGGIPNPAIAPTGNVLLSTLGFAPGSGYKATIEFTKNPIIDPNMDTPGLVTGATATAAAVDQTATINWTMPTTGSSVIARVYRSYTNDFATARLVRVEYGLPLGSTKSYVDPVPGGGIVYYWITTVNAINEESAPVSIAPVSVNLLKNGTFSDNSEWYGLGSASTSWVISNGVASKGAISASAHIWQNPKLIVGHSYTATYTLLNYGGTSSMFCRLLNGTAVNGIARSANGTFTETLVAGATSTRFSSYGNPPFTGSVDNVSLKEVI